MKSFGSNIVSFKHRSDGEFGPDDVIGVIQPHGVFETQVQATQMTEDMQGSTSVKLVIWRLTKREHISSLSIRPLNTSALVEAQKMTICYVKERDS